MTSYLWVVPVAGLIALGYAFMQSTWINKQDPGNDRMKEIAAAIQEGAMAFLGAEYRKLAIFVVVVAALLAWANASQHDSHALIALSFAIAGKLTPLVAAILMPLSSVTVVAFVSLGVWLAARPLRSPDRN